MDGTIKSAHEKMAHSIEAFKKELGKVRTGRASFAILDGVKVDYYGTPTPLSQVGTMSVPEARLITVTPWDATLIPAIEKAIQQSGLGLNPSSDGKIVRIPIPALTEERRKELVKHVKKMAEESRIAIRNVRRDAIEKLKGDKAISEDQVKRGQDLIQKETDASVHKVDDVLKAKEQEIMEV